MANKNDRLVVGYYANKAAAEAAAEDIKDWDRWDDDIKLGAMAILTIDPGSGKLHADEIGERSTKRGALWGTAIGAGLGLLTAGIALIPGIIIGAAAGAGVGALNHKSVGMSDADRDELVENLKLGGAALAVMCDDFEVEPVEARMVTEGGKVDSYTVPDETADVITKAAEAQVAASEAIDSAVDEATDEVQDAAEAASRSIDVDLPDLDDTARGAVSKIAAVTGMGAVEAAKFYDSGVAKASNLLERAATPQGRAELAEETGLDENEILVQAKKLDLMRVKGVGVKYAALLLAAGVDTVPELATRNPKNLLAKMEEINKSKGLVEGLPSEEQVGDWVAQAKELPRMIYY
ncbi:MAG: DUF4332 domain-containing protein [Candidatus Promineifilaceae bacterium]